MSRLAIAVPVLNARPKKIRMYSRRQLVKARGQQWRPPKNRREHWWSESRRRERR